MMRRIFQLFTLSFLDILIAALGSVLFMFITVDKGSPETFPVEPTKDYPVLYLDADTTKGIFYSFRTNDFKSLDLEPGKSIIVVVNSLRNLDNGPFPDQEVSGNFLDGPICPNPEHHKYKICINPDAHTPVPPEKEAPKQAACKKVHCDDALCEKVVEVIQRTGDPIEIPYGIGFAINDRDVNSDKDLDLKVCAADNTCVNSLTKSRGNLRWIDLNKSGLFKPGIVVGGELVISEKIVPGTYSVFAKYDSHPSRGKTEPPVANALLTVATKTNGDIRSETTDIDLKIEQGWRLIRTVTFDEKGNISTTK